MMRYPGGKMRLMAKIDTIIQSRWGSKTEWSASDVFVGGGGSGNILVVEHRMWEDFWYFF